MSQRTTEDRALRNILESLGMGGEGTTPPNPNPGNGGGYRAPDQWHPTPSPWQPAQGAGTGEDYMLRDHMETFVDDLLTKGTLAHGIGTFLLVLAIIACVMWVMVTYIIPTLSVMVMELVYALMPLFILVFGMCLAISTLFRR